MDQESAINVYTIYIQNGTFQKFLKSKFDPNILQKRTK